MDRDHGGAGMPSVMKCRPSELKYSTDMNRLLKGIILGTLLALPFQKISAQWSIRQSDLPGSNLERMAVRNPYLVHVIPDKEWDSSNFASEKDLQWFKDAKFGMFIHFGLSTFAEKELSWGVIAERVLPDLPVKHIEYPRKVWTSWADSLRLEKFSKEHLTRIIRKTGVKYLVVIAKHHEGFHLWDTRYSEFKSTNSPYGKDFLKEVIDACHAAGIKVGIYYSQRDWYHPDYQPVDPDSVDIIHTPPFVRSRSGMEIPAGERHRKYIDYQFDVVRELCTNYGKIDIFWFDACYWGGMFTADMWEAERLTRMIRELQPGILINNRASIPGDFDTPEQRIGMFQNRRPWESCMCLGGGWSYTPSPVKSPLTVFHKLQSSVIGNGNMLISWGMKWDGSWDESQEASFLGTGRYMKKYGEAIYGTQGGPWLPESWGGATFKGNKIYIHIINAPESGLIFLPRLPGFEVIRSRDISGHRLVLETADGGYSINTAGLTNVNSPVIMELTTDRTLSASDIEKEKEDSRENGVVLHQDTLKSGNSITIELAGRKYVKKVALSADTALDGEAVLSFSNDGKVWLTEKPVQISGRSVSIPLTTYTAGALLEGKDARFIRIELSGKTATPVRCSVLGGI